MSSSWPEELPGKPLDWRPAVTYDEWNEAVIGTRSPYPDGLGESTWAEIAHTSRASSAAAAVTWEPTTKPTVTRAEFEAAKKVLDALPPGLYAKCSQCGAWATSGFEVGFSTYDQEVLCRGCR